MNEFSTKMYNLIKQLIESNGHLMEILTSRPPENYTEKEKFIIVTDQLYIDKAIKELKEVASDE